MIKHLAVILLASHALGAAPPDAVGLHLASWHSEPGYENVNPGVFVRISGYQVGTYQNSVGKRTTYAGQAWEWPLYRSLRGTIFFGAATGYPAARVIPIGTVGLAWGAARVNYVPKISRADYYTPHALHLTVERRF